MRRAIAALPDGTWSDSFYTDVSMLEMVTIAFIACTVTIEGEHMAIDLPAPLRRYRGCQLRTQAYARYAVNV